MPQKKLTGQKLLAEQKKTTEQKQLSGQKQLNDDTITDIVKTKRHRNRPDLAKFGEENAQPGDNARFLRLARVSMSLPPIDISDPKQVEQRINDYFTFCEDNDRKPNMIGMANWLGVDRKTVQLWKTGEYRTETHLPVIKKAIDLLEELWVDYMQNGKMNPASGIFLAKNMFQYKDVQDVVVTPNNPLDTADPNTARQKYIEALPDTTDQD